VKTRIGVLKAVLVGVVALASAQAQADVIKHFVRLGAFGLNTSNVFIPLTTSGADIVTFSGSGKFTIWYTAECAAVDGYVDVAIRVDGASIGPTGDNLNDSFCDFQTRGAMHMVTGRTNSLVAGTHTVEILARKTGGVAFLSDSSLLIGK
jgi:hypothetical protein